MNKLNTRKALNPAYRKHKPLRKDVNSFTDELLKCLVTIKSSEERDEHEEHYKEPIAAFFKNTFYKDNYINTKDRIDLAIYTGNDANSDVAVLLEVKRPSNKAEFLSTENLNRKALHELLLYYLRERIDLKNNNIKHLIATNGYEWFLFKSEDFYNYFYKNKALIKEYETFRDGNKDSVKNELFYTEIAKKHIAKIENDLPFVYLNFTKKSVKEYNDANLNTLYKIFSDVHILGNSFGNDSNQLNKSFYNELLHIIGLEEVKQKGKKVIQRKSEKDRDYASILEDTVFILEDRDHLRNIKSVASGQDKAFNAGLELTLTWINRILFLKLLESQLLTYHNNAKEYRFLNTEFIDGYDQLNDLFFSALAKIPEERHPKYKDRFKYIPYLNSSLFERNALESEAFEISGLSNDQLKIYSQTVLKDNNGKPLKGKLGTLDYLFRFLDAYNFATDGTEGIEDGTESKTLINASVLGLIFEKINGYKEGSFYTPAYITMYMSKETLRRAVLQKFKEHENKQIENFEDLKAYTHRFFKPDDLKRFNKIVNSIKIVDPAVGSGHFLVSALNELISIKSELKILIDESGNSLRSEIIIDNDELYVTDEHGHLLDYKPDVKETALIQKTLFHEKQSIIENCLFGVDINPNSVKICRLRLWIELLKNTYYTDDNQLQTLPNIDINIKAGNSLISRFGLDDDLKSAFKGKEVKYSFADYKNAVAEYKTTNDKNRKYEVLQIIDEVKNNFKTKLRANDSVYIKLSKLKSKFFDLFSGNLALEPAVPYGKYNPEKERERKRKKMEKEIKQLENTVAEIKNSHIYHNAFEWRFEFPEVLDDKGKYIGFDVVIGNPPYINFANLDEDNRNHLKSHFLYKNKTDLYAFFIALSGEISNKEANTCYIVPHTWISTTSFFPLRNFMLNQLNLNSIVEFDFGVFKDAFVKTVIIEFSNIPSESIRLLDNSFKLKVHVPKSVILDDAELKINLTWTKEKHNIFSKIKNNTIVLEKILHFSRGIKTSNDKRFLSKTKLSDEYHKVIRGRNIKKHTINFDNEYIYYRPDLMKEKVGSLPHTKEVFTVSEKIITQRINSSGKLLACYDDEQFFCLDTTNVTKEIFDKSYSLKFMTGIINSSLINWWFNELFKNPTISGYELHQIPIKQISKQAQQPFIEKVEQILALKKAEPKADTSRLETEIDQMVYKLYDLTDEEIVIIENS